MPDSPPPSPRPTPGAKVVILEKMKKEFEGGNSKVSGNMWWTPTDLPQAHAVHRGAEPRPHRQGVHPGARRGDAEAERLARASWASSALPLGIFQPEHPELPGSAACAPGATAEARTASSGFRSGSRWRSGTWK